MMIENKKVHVDSRKQQEFDANFEEDTKVYVPSQKQKEFDANFIEDKNAK